MRNLVSIKIVLALLTSASVVVAAIDLGGRKDQVIKADSRLEALSLANDYLNGADMAEYAQLIDGIENPFMLGQLVVAAPVIEEQAVVVEEKPQPVIRYEDAAVLDVIATRLASQIRGTMGMGNIYYLQMQSGGLMKTGTSFAAKVPQNKDQSYKVTLTDVTDEDFALKLGDIEKRFEIPDDDPESSGTIQLDR